MQVRDLTGQRFGKLTVIRRDGRSKSGKILWLCRCDCGNETHVFTSNLTHGKSTCCGKSCRVDSMVSVGDVFGALTVMRKDGRTENKKDGRRHTLWLCKCECGNELDVMSTDLLDGYVTSCGCHIEGKRRRAKTGGIVDGTMLSIIARSEPNRNNTSGVRGVTWVGKSNKWVAMIKFRGRNYGLGHYSDLADAAEARRAAEEALFDPVLEAHGRDPTSEEAYRAILDAALAKLKEWKGPI